MAQRSMLPWVAGAGVAVAILTVSKAAQAANLPLFQRKVKGLQTQNVPMVRGLIERWSPIFSAIPVDVALAIAGNESRWNPQVKPNLTGGDLRRGGAWGLFQMTLATAKPIAQRLAVHSNATVQALVKGWDGTGPKLAEPNLNTLFALSELDRLMRKFHDSTLAVAAYNRGEGAVAKMVASQKNVQSVDYVQNVSSILNELKQKGLA